MPHFAESIVLFLIDSLYSLFCILCIFVSFIFFVSLIFFEYLYFSSNEIVFFLIIGDSFIKSLLLNAEREEQE
mgnify:FL=1